MKILNICVAAVVLSASNDVAAGQKPRGAEAALPRLVQTIPLPGVEGPTDRSGIRGRIDHMAYDPATKRLLVACIANGSLEVVDLDQGKRVKSVPGLKKPQGVGVAGSAGIIAVSSGGDGRVHFYDSRSFHEKAALPAGEDADNVRFAPNGKIYVGFGGGAGPGGLAEFNPATLARTGTIHLPLRPESFQFIARTTVPAYLNFADRLYANQPGAKQATNDGAVVAVDRASGNVLWTSHLRKTARNFPMAVDSLKGRIFVASRLPPKLIAMDAGNGRVLDEAGCPPDADDLFFDDKAGRVMVIGGGNRTEGKDDGAGAAIDVFTAGPKGTLTKTASLPLPPHTRTGLFIPQRRTICVAVPPAPARPSEIREYKLP